MKEWLDNLSNHYGYTSNPREAGYIHTNGKLVDFGGNKKRYPFRTYNHRQIEFVSPEIAEIASSRTKGQAMRHFMAKTGAIRISVGESVMNVDMAALPTSEQIAQIVNIARNLRRAVIEYTPPNGKHSVYVIESNMPDRNIPLYRVEYTLRHLQTMPTLL